MRLFERDSPINGRAGKSIINPFVSSSGNENECSSKRYTNQEILFPKNFHARMDLGSKHLYQKRSLQCSSLAIPFETLHPMRNCTLRSSFRFGVNLYQL